MKSEREIELTKREFELIKNGVEAGIDEVCEISGGEFPYARSPFWSGLKHKIDILEWVLTDKI